MPVSIDKPRRLSWGLAIAAAALFVAGWLSFEPAKRDESALRATLADVLKSGGDFELLSVYAGHGPVPESLKVAFTGERLGGWRVLGKASIPESGQRAALAEALANAARCFEDSSCLHPACFRAASRDSAGP